MSTRETVHTTGGAEQEGLACACGCRRRSFTDGKVPDTSWHDGFIATLRQVPNVTAACSAVGKTREVAYQQRNKYQKFRLLWDEAIKQGVENLEATAMLRGMRQSDKLLEITLRACWPEKYRDPDYNAKVAQLLETLIVAIGTKNMSNETLTLISAGKSPEEILKTLAAAGAGNGSALKATEMLRTLAHAVTVGNSRMSKEIAAEALAFVEPVNGSDPLALSS